MVCTTTPPTKGAASLGDKLKGHLAVCPLHRWRKEYANQLIAANAGVSFVVLALPPWEVGRQLNLRDRRRHLSMSVEGVPLNDRPAVDP